MNLYKFLYSQTTHTLNLRKTNVFMLSYTSLNISSLHPPLIQANKCMLSLTRTSSHTNLTLPVWLEAND